MQTIHETRRTRLAMLVKKYGKMADLCEALGYARTETARLTRIHNGNTRHERGGKPYQLGDELARGIEAKLGLEVGWMDTPPTYNELLDPSDPRMQVMSLMEHMPADLWPTVVRLVDAIAQPPAANGSNGH